MTQTKQNLGFKPRFGVFDAAFDAFCVYEYFDRADGFATVPFVERGQKGKRTFDESGAPFCQAGLAMTLRYTFQCKTPLIQYERGRYACPLLYPDTTGEAPGLSLPKLVPSSTRIGRKVGHQPRRKNTLPD